MRDESRDPDQKWYDEIVAFLLVCGLYDIVKIFVDEGTVTYHPLLQKILL